MAVVASTSALVSSEFFRSTPLFVSQLKSFSDLPDDVILEVFTCMDFSSIIALRQTCRKCYRISKTTTLWLDVYRWITKDAEDWRTLLAESHLTLPADDLEKATTLLVRFERKWSRGHEGVRRTASFYVDDGLAFIFVPGGRWFLSSTIYGIRGVICYDLDSLEIQRRMLITQKRQDQVICTMDSAIDSRDSSLEFNLAAELMTHDHYNSDCRQPRNLAVWRVTLDQDDHLSAELVSSVPVFRMTPFRRTISLSGDFLLRLSLTLSNHPVFTVHRWSALDDDKFTHSILIPIRGKIPTYGAKLLPDGRILSISDSWIEIYSPPDHQWEESFAIPQDVPRSTPWWVYEYAPTFYRPLRNVSRLLHSRSKDWVTLSIHNGESLFNFRIPLHGEQDPEVTSTAFSQLGTETRIGLGTSRAVISTTDAKRVTLVTLDYRPGMRSLHTFAGVAPREMESNSRNRITEIPFDSPHPTSDDPWLIDEKSGRVLCSPEMPDPYEFVVFYFVD